MARKNGIYCYNVYDENGDLVFEKLISSEIAEELGIPQSKVSSCALSGKLVKGKYKIVNVDKDAPCEGMKWKQEDINMWNEVRSPFLKVQWVKERGLGVKVLRGSKS